MSRWFPCLRWVDEARNCRPNVFPSIARKRPEKQRKVAKNPEPSPNFHRCAERQLCGNFGSNTLMYKQYTLVAALFLAGTALVPFPVFGQVTFNKDIAPLLFDRCAQCHHPEGSAPFSLLTYQAARQHATQMAVVTRKRLMP